MSAPDFVIPPGHPSHPDQRAPAQADPIEAFCAAAVARLQEALPPSMQVGHFPDDPEQYELGSYPAAALVAYGGSRFGAEGVRGHQGMGEELRLQIALLVRSLRGESGAYALIHQIRLALHGAVLAGATGLRPVEIEMVDQRDQVFEYRLVFAAQVPTIPGASRAGPALPRGFAPRP